MAKSEIIQGLNAGRHVIAHSDQITVPGFTGEGYIIFSPVDGNGAWKISGGGNGSELKEFAENHPLLTGMLVMLGVIALAFAGPIGFGVALLIEITTIIWGLWFYSDNPFAGYYFGMGQTIVILAGLLLPLSAAAAAIITSAALLHILSIVMMFFSYHINMYANVDAAKRRYV